MQPAGHLPFAETFLQQGFVQPALHFADAFLQQGLVQPGLHFDVVWPLAFVHLPQHLLLAQPIGPVSNAAEQNTPSVIMNKDLKQRFAKPSYGVIPYDGLANRWFQPLTHLSSG